MTATGRALTFIAAVQLAGMLLVAPVDPTLVSFVVLGQLCGVVGLVHFEVASERFAAWRADAAEFAAARERVALEDAATELDELERLEHEAFLSQLNR